MQPETLSAIAAMITGFNGFSTEPDVLLDTYRIAAHGNRDDAVQSAAARFIRGEVKDHKASRLPTVAEFAKECRTEHSRITANENMRRRLRKPEEQIEHSADHRSKMSGLIDTWRRAWAGDRQAQKELEPYGWRK